MMIRWFEERGELSFFIMIMIALGIFFVSSLSFKNNLISFSLVSVVYHMTAFFFLALFLMISVVKGKYKQYIPILIVMAIVYGISDELHQFLVPGRSSSLGDVFVDTVGIVFASLIYLISLEFRK